MQQRTKLAKIKRGTLNLHLTSNPQRVVLQQSPPGVITHCSVRGFMLTPAVLPTAPYYQVDFGDGVRDDLNLGTGINANCIQLRPNLTSEINVPVHISGGRLPFYFNVTIYKPGESNNVVALNADGAMIFMEYEFVPM